MKNDALDVLITLALAEDLADLGDVTSEAIFSEERAEAVLKSKDSGILSGSGAFVRVFERIGADLSVSFLKKDGESLYPGDVVAVLDGPLKALLKGERIALNFICYLSGIATSAYVYKEAAKARGKAIILDTRKTLPGYRSLAKAAVLHGGAQNHRMGLYDMVMIKDNHVDGAGSITAAVTKVRERWGDTFRIETECRTVEEVREALRCNVDVIMLDNMVPGEVKEALGAASGLNDGAAAAHTPLFEVSGNMSLEKIGEYGVTGVHYISVGNMTHSVKAFDFSLILKTKKMGGLNT